MIKLQLIKRYWYEDGKYIWRERFILQKIAVIGAGTMGSGIAQVVAEAGYEVILRDIEEEMLDKAVTRIAGGLNRLVQKERITEDEKNNILDRVTTTKKIDSIRDVDLVIEAATEKMEMKKKIFRQLDEVCQKKTILASNTSALSITELASVTSRPEKVLGVHFFNPAPIMKLVELIRGLTTSEEVFAEVKVFIEKISKKPVEVNESPGFIVNRLLIPMINEAAFLLGEKIALAEDIDSAMKLGANHPIGPLALGDLIGLDVCLAIMETLYQDFADSKYRPAPLLRKKVRAGQLGRKSGEGFYTY